MIANVIDRRQRPYRFQKINAVIESTWHDNTCPFADQAPKGKRAEYEKKEHISLLEAVQWANTFESDVTLYLYEESDGIYAETPHTWRNRAIRK